MMGWHKTNNRDDRKGKASEHPLPLLLTDDRENNTMDDTMKGRGKGEEGGDDDAHETKGRGKEEMMMCMRQERGERERREGVGYPHGRHLPTPQHVPHH